MKECTFENLPYIIGKLYSKVSKIEKLIKISQISANNSDEELMTIEAAAELLKLSVATIYTKVSKNEIPVNKQGKRLYFYKQELLNWIKSGRIKTIDEIKQNVEVKFSSDRYSK
ncbi:helix-turn-helix domain-containing protein [Flavobacterium sp. CF136]|uniref:helix-turn-helix domain-containing protein n=1 Tax=Flavobacterium sp. (strain CF136) TaxID=1144313 RepID=UPI0002718E48|nr:helix-turn-helix domain-containing protein [Flavobacterium sp. CF136]EJL62817.1 DNA-binding protein, excisionase family [Flavobacterium sp. CF136]